MVLFAFINSNYQLFCNIYLFQGLHTINIISQSLNFPLIIFSKMRTDHDPKAENRSLRIPAHLCQTQKFIFACQIHSSGASFFTIRPFQCSVEFAGLEYPFLFRFSWLQSTRYTYIIIPLSEFDQHHVILIDIIVRSRMQQPILQPSPIIPFLDGMYLDSYLIRFQRIYETHLQRLSWSIVRRNNDTTRGSK